MPRPTRPRLRTATAALVALLAVLLPACTTRDDVHFNRYAPANGDPTLLQAADSCTDQAEWLVRDLDTRLEHGLY